MDGYIKTPRERRLTSVSSSCFTGFCTEICRFLLGNTLALTLWSVVRVAVTILPKSSTSCLLAAWQVGAPLTPTFVGAHFPCQPAVFCVDVRLSSSVFLSSVLLFCGLPFTSATNWSAWTVIRPISWTVVDPIRHVRSFCTTTNSTSCFSWVFGFVTVNVVSPTGLTFDPFHIINFPLDWRTCCLWTNRCVIVFTSAPVSSRNRTSQSFTCINAVTRFFTVSPAMPYVCSHSVSLSAFWWSTERTAWRFFLHFALKWFGALQNEHCLPHAAQLSLPGQCL